MELKMELYKKYRPKTLKGVVGNEATVQTLNTMVAKGRVPHTILFSGPSGCGKTTLARIMRSYLNCSEMDFKELNCSDFRGVDTIREIAQLMNLSPIGGETKIWLLDEVHQMTKDAQNAALKILEDTPSHVYFFLCTTDPQKILPTIKTRCCNIEVEPLSSEECQKLIQRVVRNESLDLDIKIIKKIAESCGGSARKTLVTLERVLNLPEQKRMEAIKEDAETSAEVIELCRALIKKESWKRVSAILRGIKEEPESVRWAVLGYARSCLLGGNKQAAVIIDAFQENFYDSKEAGLALASWVCIEGF